MMYKQLELDDFKIEKLFKTLCRKKVDWEYITIDNKTYSFKKGEEFNQWSCQFDTDFSEVVFEIQNLRCLNDLSIVKELTIHFEIEEEVILVYYVIYN